MFHPFRRRFTVALILASLIPMILVGPQSTAFAMKAVYPPGDSQNHNPVCGTAYAEKLCIGVSQDELIFTWKGKTSEKFNDEQILVQPEWQVNGQKDQYYSPSWTNKESYSYIVKLSKPNLYEGGATIGNPKGGYGYVLYYRFVVPRVGNSYLAVATKSLPDATRGVRYVFRYSVRGGTPPYSWIPIYLPPGLSLIRTGSKAGTITGIPTDANPYWTVPVIVRDKVGHSAYSGLQLQINP